mgnify:CR=1 FL=1
MRIDVLTLFPEMFESPLGYGIIKRAQEQGIVDIVLTNIRDFAVGEYRKVDDKPYGGGPGMVMMPTTGNVVARSVVQRGDVDAALAGAAYVASASFQTAAIEHAFLEPEAALAVPRGASGPDGLPVTAHRIHVYSPGQGAWEDRRQVASLYSRHVPKGPICGAVLARAKPSSAQ